MTDLAALAERDALPPEFRFLVAEFPREGWAAAAGPFTAFYLERHEFFRGVTARLEAETETFLDDGADPRRFAGAVSRFGSLFLTQLHAHHRIEDEHYFPRISGLEPRATRAFDLLESDHHAMDGILARFGTDANAAIAAAEETRLAEADRLRATLAETRRLLARHLTDEEDIVVPLMLKFGADAALD